jgi:hypothetical protein
VHSGNATPPPCMAQSLAIAYRIAPLSNLIVLISSKHVAVLNKQLFAHGPSLFEFDSKRFKIISIESLSDSQLSKDFKKSSKADQGFRDGFWLETANRFMLIADLMLQYDFKNCLHLENDNVLYFDPTSKLEIFRSHARFSVPFDRSRAIPGIVWYKDAAIAKDLANYMMERSEIPDFDVLRDFCACGLYDAKPLPTMSRDYAVLLGVSPEDYCLGYEEFAGIFDAAAIGQYIGGVDPRNIAGNSRFFINETSDLDVSKCDVFWSYSNNHRMLMLEMKEQSVAVLSLHAHAKDSLGVSPYNCINIDNESQLITGERIQEFADLTITSQAVTSFHGQENIRTKDFLEIPYKKLGKFFRKKITEIAPDDDWIERCQNAKIIFIYTHLIPYFKKYIAPRLYSPFLLISHNSDDGVGENELELLNHPFLCNWFAQNCEVSHSKLRALPIGLTNRQWGKEKYINLINASKNYHKKKLIYGNFSVHTHYGRHELLEIISENKNITRSHNLGYEDYLAELAQHKFCLCPRGNGIDTHRFWESQYLNTIPIIINADWTPSYSGLPILLLNSWDQLSEINFEKEYIRISSSFYYRNELKLKFYEYLIRAEINNDRVID